MLLPNITAVEYLKDFRITVTFSGGKKSTITSCTMILAMKDYEAEQKGLIWHAD